MSQPGVTRGQRRALGVLAVAAVLVFLWVALPVGLGLFLGTLVAFTIEPLYQRLTARIRKPFLAAVLCSLGCTLVIAGSVALLAFAIASRGAEALGSLGSSMHTAVGPIEHALRHAHIDPGDLPARIREGTEAFMGRAASAIATIADLTIHALLTLFFLALSTAFVLRHWRSLTVRVEQMLPLHPSHTRSLFRGFRRAGRTILLGTVVTGLAQGLFASIGFALFHVPNAPLLGALTTIASIVPAIGTLLVWVPAGIWLIATGHVGAGIGLLVYCSFTVIIVCDYVVRPLLVGSTERDVPSLITFIALFGGVEVFGVIGLVLGPVLISLCLAILRTWEQLESDRNRETMPTPLSSPRFSSPDWTERPSH